MAEEALHYLAGHGLLLKDFLFPACCFIVMWIFQSFRGNPIPSQGLWACWVFSLWGSFLVLLMPGSFESFRTQFNVASEWSCLPPVSRFFIGSRLFSFTTQFPSENISQSIMTLWYLFTCVLFVSLWECKPHESGYLVHHRAMSSCGRLSTPAFWRDTQVSPASYKLCY